MKSTVKKLVVGFTMFTLGMMVLSEYAQAVPQLINYQAVIKNQSNSQTVPDGPYQITYRIYTTLTGGSPVWLEISIDTVASGVLNHVLGTVSTLNLPVNSNYYLTIQLNGDSEMSPREHLTSVGSALTAGGLSAGASWYGSVTGNNTSSSPTLMLNSSGIGLYSIASSYGVFAIGDIGVLGASTSLGEGVGVGGESIATSGENFGVEGIAINSTGVGFGVYGIGMSSTGVGVGVFGEAGGLGYGVFGVSEDSGYGVAGQGTNNAIGVAGYAENTIGIYGFSDSANPSIYGYNTVGGTGVEGVGTNPGGFFGGALGVYGVASDAFFTVGVEGDSYSIGAGVEGINYGGGYGVLGTGNANWGVYGTSTDNTLTYSGVWGENDSGNGYGVYGIATGFNSAGVVGFTDNGLGVWGKATVNGGYAVFGTGSNGAIGGVFSSDVGTGVSGTSNNSYGIAGYSSYFGVYGSGNDVGVYGLSNNVGVWGENTSGGYGVVGESSRSGDGVYASSSSGHGVYIGNGGIYVTGTIVATGSKSGYVVDLCKNVDSTALTLGDVVIIQGNSSPAVLGTIPVVNVSRTATSYNSAVVGVVDSYVSVTTNQASALANVQGENAAPSGMRLEVNTDSTQTVTTGAYVNVVTLGSFQAIKVDASYGAVHPGDLLTTSPNPGYAMKVTPKIIDGETFYPNGCIIGKSLGSLESGQGSVPIFVAHQ